MANIWNILQISDYLECIIIIPNGDYKETTELLF